jgi:hypothetical protein
VSGCVHCAMAANICCGARPFQALHWSQQGFQQLYDMCTAGRALARILQAFRCCNRHSVTGCTALECGAAACALVLPVQQAYEHPVPCLHLFCVVLRAAAGVFLLELPGAK